MNLIRTKHSKETLLKISKAIFTCQLAKNYLHEIRFTSYFKKALKYALNKVIVQLEAAEKKEFAVAYEKVDDETFSLSELKEDLINEIADLGPGHYKMVTDIIRDYKKHYDELVEEEKTKNNDTSV